MSDPDHDAFQLRLEVESLRAERDALQKRYIELDTRRYQAELSLLAKDEELTEARRQLAERTTEVENSVVNLSILKRGFDLHESELTEARRQLAEMSEVAENCGKNHTEAWLASIPRVTRKSEHELVTRYEAALRHARKLLERLCYGDEIVGGDGPVMHDAKKWLDAMELLDAKALEPVDRAKPVES